MAASEISDGGRQAIPEDANDDGLALRFIDKCGFVFDEASKKSDLRVCASSAKSALAVAIAAVEKFGKKELIDLAIVWYYRLEEIYEIYGENTAKTVYWAKPIVHGYINNRSTQARVPTARQAASSKIRFHTEASAPTEIPITLKSQNTAYRARVALITIGVGVTASLCAYKWPIRGHHVQSEFFLSLTSSLITLLGIVFTLFLIGTQLTATRTNISLKRVFGAMAWLYLLLFLATTVWTLAISYRSGNPNDPLRICPSFGPIKVGCTSEIAAGRIGIFGLIASLILLPIFIAYVYRRLTPAYMFASLARQALRVRKEASIKDRFQQFRREIISSIPDSDAAAQGLNYLLELGALSAQRRRFHDNSAAYTLAGHVTYLLRGLVTQSEDIRLQVNALRTIETWCIWLVSHADFNTTAPYNHVIRGRQVADLVRSGRECANTELQKWQDGEGQVTVAKASIHFAHSIARTCKPRPIHLSMGNTARILRECAARKSVDGSMSEFNMALRGLISLCRICSLPNSSHLKGHEVFKQLASTFISLGTLNETRKPIPDWILDDLHNLTDEFSVRQDYPTSSWRYYLRSLAALTDQEVAAIVMPPQDPKEHKHKGVRHSPWQKIILEKLEKSDRQDLHKSLADLAARSWIKEGDLPGLVAFYENLASQYSLNRGINTPFLLVAVAAYTRRCYESLGPSKGVA